MNNKQRKQIRKLNELYERRQFLNETLMPKTLEAGAFILQITEEGLDRNSEAHLNRARCMVQAAERCKEIRETREKTEGEIEILERELIQQKVDLPKRIRASELVATLRDLAEEAGDSPFRDRLTALAEQAALIV